MIINLEKPIGSTKKMIKYDPIMEQFNKYHQQGLHCSIDRGDLAVPQGACNFFDRHGYMIIKNLYDVSEFYSEVPSERGIIDYHGSLEKFTHYQQELQVPGSLARYSYPQYKKAHSKIRLILEDILGEKLYNTYYYDRFYFSGQRLIRHTDRPACEVSVSIQIKTNATKPWPFCIETKQGEEHLTILQDGWGVLYKGCERDHWRDSLKSRHKIVNRLYNRILRKVDDTYHHQIFFHYVYANGNNVHHANDSLR